MIIDRLSENLLQTSSDVLKREKEEFRGENYLISLLSSTGLGLSNWLSLAFSIHDCLVLKVLTDFKGSNIAFKASEVFNLKIFKIYLD